MQNDAFPYCPSWVLSWQYRKQNLLKELLSYRADILCLQVPASAYALGAAGLQGHLSWDQGRPLCHVELNPGSVQG